MYHNARNERRAVIVVLRFALVAEHLRGEEVYNEISDPFRGVPVNSGLLECVTAVFLESFPTFRMDLVTSGFSSPKKKSYLS
jgi:hypothetical protein